MPSLKVDGIDVEIEPGATVLQACEAAGKEVPRFCYHDRLSIAGNCRMCLVEVRPGPPKPAASCAMPAADGMEVLTASDMAREARQGVMEFLLINHPLDCPICDQGGECDLQDQAMAYGFSGSRFSENKRAVEDKYMGPLIKTEMTRCIHCTRCVRFASEIAGVDDLGLINRGENAEITSLGKAVSSELSGNVIDLCPVGALTSRPYAFTARSWELLRTESVDAMDAVGSNIRIDARGNEVLRVLPRLHEDINEEWISDKTRFACDGLGRQRLDKPYLRGADGRLAPVGWDEALTAAAERIKAVGGVGVGGIIGDQACAESMFALKELFADLGSPHLDCRQDEAKLDPACRAGWQFNTTIAGIEDADACLLIGTNPRLEAPMVNARLRKRWLASGFPVAGIGAPCDLAYPCEWLGEGGAVLEALAAGGHPFAEILTRAERPMLVLGMGALAREDGAAVLAAARRLAEKTGMVSENWNGFNVLHIAAARVGGMELGCVPGPGGLDAAGMVAAADTGRISVLYLLGADEIAMPAPGRCFVIYQGHHGDAGAHRADLVLPGAAYTEKSATYANTEGRVQRAERAVFPPGEAREDWTIIRALSGVLGKPLPYDSLDALRGAMGVASPGFLAIDTVERASWGNFGAPGSIADGAFRSPVDNFYMTDPISRASETMARCIAEITRPEDPEGRAERVA